MGCGLRAENLSACTCLLAQTREGQAAEGYKPNTAQQGWRDIGPGWGTGVVKSMDT